MTQSDTNINIIFYYFKTISLFSEILLFRVKIKVPVIMNYLHKTFL
jgi:hypothetical protein